MWSKHFDMWFEPFHLWCKIMMFFKHFKPLLVCVVAKIHANIKASAFPSKGAHVTHYHYLARFRQKVPNICIYFA